MPIPPLGELLAGGIRGRRVLVRADLNVPLRDGAITDDTRIRASLPTLSQLLEAGARVIVTSHLGRPKGQRRPELSLRPVAERLAILLDTGVSFCEECVGERAAAAVRELREGQLIVLENLRFHPGEERNDADFARALADLADAYVNDAFGSAHRAHASTAGVAELVGRVAAGELLRSELDHLDGIRKPERPLLVILGGAKVSDKLASLQALARHADTLAIGGAMAYTFLAGEGRAVGASRLEPDRIEDARRVSRAALDAGRRLLLPRDHRVVERIQTGAPVKVVQEIPDGWIAVDLGPETARDYADEAGRARTLFWNGPMGIFEVADYAAGTETVAHAVAGSRANTIVGGGDSLAAVNHLGLGHRIDHLSTGGGASLEYIQGRTLPGVAALQR